MLNGSPLTTTQTQMQNARLTRQIMKATTCLLCKAKLFIRVGHFFRMLDFEGTERPSNRKRKREKVQQNKDSKKVSERIRKYRRKIWLPRQEYTK